jgi:hypothetical protein
MYAVWRAEPVLGMRSVMPKHACSVTPKRHVRMHVLHSNGSLVLLCGRNWQALHASTTTRESTVI